MHIHNGWFEAISGGLGLLPIEKIQFLDESEWGLPREILQSIELSKTYYVFIMVVVASYVLTQKMLPTLSRLSGGQMINLSYVLTFGLSWTLG